MRTARSVTIPASLVLCLIAVVSCVPGSQATATAAGGLTAAQERPAERVSPPPAGNANAVVWRTPEPPANPQKCDLWVNPKDGMEMVYIPAGEFLMGASDAQVAAWLGEYNEDEYELFRDEQPQFRVTLKGYWIGRTEVTNAQYQRFVRATGRPAPEGWWRGQMPAGLGDFPVLSVDWADAQAYSGWAGGRLPTEPEWERAARGGDGRIFPWGVQWDRGRCRNFELIAGQRYAKPGDNQAVFQDWMGGHDEIREGLTPAGSYPTGASPFGCLDIAGNVLEWCADWYDPAAYSRYAQGEIAPPASSPQDARVARGGSFEEAHPRAFRCAARYFYDPLTKDINLGFRCARAAR